MAVSVQALRDALAGAVGPDRLLTDPATLDRFAVDGVRPAWVARPSRIDRVSRLLALAAEERLAVVPRGSGALLGLGNPPRRADLVCDLSGLAAVVAYEPADLTATVEGGIPLATLAAHLAERRQFLPMDPLDGASRSLGGVLATNGSGPLRFRYGTARDLLLGVRFVQADGTVTWGGSRVVKSVTGYDVPKLLIGSLGTLGIVVEATLRLQPRPEAEATWLASCDAAERGAGLLGAILDSPLQPNRLEVVSGAGPGSESDEAITLAVCFGSVREAVTAQGEQLAALAGREGGEVRTAEPDFWSRLGTGLADSAVVLKIATLPSQSLALCGETRRLATDLGIAPRIVGEAGNGVLHVAFRGALSAALWDTKVITPLRERVAPDGGTVIVERAPREIKDRLDVWGPIDPATLAIMKRLKAEFDPAGILNPGRFVARI